MMTCMGVDIRGLLRSPKRVLARAFQHPTEDRRMTADEARDYLLDCIADGKEVLPLGKCDNWNFKTGCQGHHAGEELANTNPAGRAVSGSAV